MKKFLFITITISLSQPLFALNIRDVAVSRISQNSINISLTTEAVELYYFQSCTYSISENAISVNAFFVSGFGSTIAYLNNNFGIPLHADEAAHYRLLVRVFYISLSEVTETAMLQDEFKLEFTTPIYDTVIASEPDISSIDNIVSPNPTSGILYISEDFDNIMIFDKLGREIIPIKFFYNAIDLSGLKNGTYYIAIFNGEKVIRKRVLLEK